MKDEKALSRTTKYKKHRNKKGKRFIAFLLTAFFLGLGIHFALDQIQLEGNMTGQSPPDENKDLSGAEHPNEKSNSEDGNEAGPQEDPSTDQNDPTDGANGSNSSNEEGKGGLGQTEDESKDGLNDADARVTLNFVGDVLLGSTVNYFLDEHGYEYPYEHTLELLQQADFTMANLETPITNRGEPLEDKLYTYRSDPKVLPAFKEAGFDLVNLANNHVLDYGLDGLIQTFKNLKEHDIAYVGAGENSEEAFQAHFLEKNGITIAVLGFSRVVPEGWWKATDNTPGVADTYNYTKPVEVIKSAKENADLVIVMAHWGTERELMPNEIQTDLAHRFADAGADLIIGTHPHVLQGIEYYNGSWIAYSLGNFIFTTRPDSPRTWESAILQAACDKNAECNLSLVPVFTYSALPKPLKDEEADKLIEELNQRSFGVQIGQDGSISVKHEHTDANP